MDGQIISALAAGDKQKAKLLAEKFGWLKYKNGKPAFQIERFELEEKLKQLHIEIPW
jgi:hypothetical protein